MKRFMYFYKTTNKINGKYYYGVHRTDNLEDEYLGSGLAFVRAKRKYGKHNFSKEILKFFSTEEEMFLWEEEMITEEIVRDKQSYNLTVGGKGFNSDLLKRFWDSKAGTEQKKIFKKWFGGYINGDFVARWKPKYEEVKSDVLQLIASNLPDFIIDRYIEKKYGYSFKFPRLLKYYIHEGYLSGDVSRDMSKKFFAEGRYTAIPMLKSSFAGLKNDLVFKALNLKSLDIYAEVLNYALDLKYSDSFMYNNEDISALRCVKYDLGYYQYLGLIKKTGNVKIDIRGVYPQAQRATGLKTLYIEIPEFKQNYILLDGETLDTYTLKRNHDDNGSFISITRNGNLLDGDWKTI